MSFHNPAQCWLRFSAQTYESMDFLVPVLGMIKRMEDPDTVSHDIEADTSSTQVSLNQDQIAIADEIIACLRESYFPKSFRYSPPKTNFVFSKFVNNWLESIGKLEPVRFVAWGICIECILHSDSFEQMLLRQGFFVERLPIYNRENYDHS